MLPLVLLAGLAVLPVDFGEPILEVRVADVDADGQEDLVAVSATHLYLLRGGHAPAVRRDAPPLTVVGRGMLGVVRDGRYHAVEDPFGEWKEGAAGEPSLLAALGSCPPALLQAPGDLDGDGRDDPLLCGPAGFATPQGTIAVVPEAQLGIGRNEAFAVEYRIPVPVVGNWSGKGRELVLLANGEVRSFLSAHETDRVPVPLPERGEEAEAIRRNHLFVRDVNGDGRLDMVVIMAKGKTELFNRFEATARLFLGGHVYDHERKGFYRPASFLKISGILLDGDLVDVDGDGDLDLVLSSIDVSIFSMATGTAPGTYHLFRFEGDGYQRTPAWTFTGDVPLSAFTEQPDPPVRFLPDLDGNGRPEALAVNGAVQVHEANAAGEFVLGPAVEVKGAGRPAIGRQRAAVPHDRGLVVVEKAK